MIYSYVFSMQFFWWKSETECTNEFFIVIQEKIIAGKAWTLAIEIQGSLFLQSREKDVRKVSDKVLCPEQEQLPLLL